MKFLFLFLYIISINSYAAECGTFYNDDLSEIMKKIIIENVTIPVGSTMLKNVAEFSTLGIHEDGESDIQTGQSRNIDNLKNKDGYAYIIYKLSSLKDIPIISSNTEEHFSSVKDFPTFKITNGVGELQFVGLDNSILAAYEFELKEGENKVVYCDFYKIQDIVKRVNVTVKSWKSELSEQATVQQLN